MVLFCNTSTQQVVEAYIYEFSRCSSDVSLSSESAAAVVNIFWITSTIARGAAIIISRITSPKTYIVFDYCLAIVALSMLLIRNWSTFQVYKSISLYTVNYTLNLYYCDREKDPSYPTFIWLLPLSHLRLPSPPCMLM